MIEMVVKEVGDRLAIAAALLKNGYVVWFESRKDGKVSKQLVCAAELRKGPKLPGRAGLADPMKSGEE